ncbi:hypothetical protein ABW20_dc0102174 [Dactylellina cionopaga]|nr:hypothetical protein ABW20_dc0102174 [Dactylellina cionopaga]
MGIRGGNDTGAVLRALIPLKPVIQRQALREYDGPASIFNARVTCTRPKFLLDPPKLNPSSDTWVEVNGLLEIITLDITSTIYSEREIPSLPNAVEFTAELGNYGIQLILLSEVASLPAEPSEDVIFLLLNSTFGDSADQNTTTIDAIGSSEDIKGDFSKAAAPASIKLLQASSHGAWIKLDYITEPGTPFVLELSLCHTKIQSGPYQITLRGTGNYSEPVVTQNANTPIAMTAEALAGPGGGQYLPGNIFTYKLEAIGDARNISTEAVRKQLGVTTDRHQLSVRDRGLWEFHNPLPSPDELLLKWPSPTPASDELEDAHPFSDGINLLSILPLRNVGDSACLVGYCGKGAPSKYYRQVFLDTMETTGSPALALQAFFTMLCTNSYYKTYDVFDRIALAHITIGQAALMPTGYRGLAFVIAICCLQLLIFVITWVIFIRYTKNSLLGNSWQSISQIMPQFDTVVPGLLEVARFSTDKEVKRHIESVGLGKIPVNPILKNTFGYVKLYIFSKQLLIV